MAGCCEYGNENLGSIIYDKFFISFVNVRFSIRTRSSVEFTFRF